MKAKKNNIHTSSEYLNYRNWPAVLRVTLMFFLLSVSFPISAQRPSSLGDSIDTETYNMGEVVIKAGIVRSGHLHVLQRISGPDVRRMPVQSIGELLRTIASVDIRQRGPFGVQADLGVRGGSFDQTMILLNGINFTDPQTGHNNLTLPIDLEGVENIDVLNGASALRYGSHALSGAVNIVTGISKPGNVRSSLTLGDHALNKISVSTSDSTGKLSHMLSFSTNSSNGYRHNTDFHEQKIFLQGEYRHQTGITDIQAGFLRKDFGANGFYSLRYPDQFEALRTGFMSIRYASNTRINFSPAIYLRSNTDRFELMRNDNSIPFNHHRTLTGGFNMVVKTGRTSLSVDLREEQINSNVLGELMKDPVGIYNRRYSRFITGISAEHSYTYKNLSLIAGMLAQYNHDISRAGLYPSISSNLKISDKTEIYASAGKTLRMPSFTDMFYKSPVQAGNRLLEPETAGSVEIGFRNASPGFVLTSALFRRKVDNMIDWVKDPSPDSLIWRSMNHGNIYFTGGNVMIELRPRRFDKIDLLSISYAFLDADRSSALLSKYAFDYIRHKIVSNIIVNTFWDIHASAVITFQDRNNFYQDNNGISVPYKPFWLCDLKIYKKIRNNTLHIAASNLFNTIYYDYGGIPQPGTWFSGGLVIDMPFRR